MKWKSLLGDWFLIGMVSMVVLATLFPEVGRSGGYLHADQLSDIGIFLIFFLYGVNLSLENLREGISRWRLHLVVQGFTFIVFPLLFLALRPLAAGRIPEGLLLGFLYLCALPSTISSSVAMTGVARGNVAGAIFNATLSSLLGIFLTPLLVSLEWRGPGGGGSLGETIVKIATLLLLPFAIGQLARPWFGGWFGRRKKYTAVSDKCVILLLVFSSFCDSVAAGLWTNYGYRTLGTALAGAALLLAAALTLTTSVTRALGFSTEDEIAAVMCGSKKTLASGVPMARLLFAGHPALGLIVLPIMFYHQAQLFVCSILAGRYAARGEVTASSAPEPSAG